MSGLSSALPADGDFVNQFPIQVTKVQRPPLREQTLQRDRLLDWLDAKIHRRVVMAVAEAGYGKTTLFADFARRTRVRTLWYRLDEEDRDWFSVLNYLVAAGREVDPDFAPNTAALLREVSAGGITRQAATNSFLTELAALGDTPTAIVFDDYYLVDDVPDVQALIQELISRAPERLSLIFLTRRRPRIAVARLRALGELAELSADDLRFDAEETDRLFRETYGRPLEPDVVADLHRRTEGWAASLQLVQAAVRNRSAGEIRSFVRNLSGAQSELYDYLAEEVVGDLDDETQQFLMKTSLLQVVDPELTQVVAGFPPSRGRALIDACEALGLLARRGETTRYSQRYHPLVRDFLEARLRRQVGDPAIADLHRSVARFGEGRSWRLAAHHFAAAEDIADLHRVLATATPAIMGSGEFVLAESYIARFPPPAPNPWFEIVLSRTELQSGQVEAALDRARAAVASFDAEAAPADDPGANLALANLMSVELTADHGAAAEWVGLQLQVRAPEANLRAISRAMVSLVRSCGLGSLTEARTALVDAATLQEQTGYRHYQGVSMLNLACVERARGDASAALEAATQATEMLMTTSAGPEVVSARTARAWALAHLGRWDEARKELEAALSLPYPLVHAEIVAEAAEIHADYGDLEDALRLLGLPEPPPQTAIGFAMWTATALHVLMKLGRKDDAAPFAQGLMRKSSADPGHEVRSMLLSAQLEHLSRRPSALASAERAIQAARAQGAFRWHRLGLLLKATLVGEAEADTLVARVVREDPGTLSAGAELVGRRLSALRPATLESVWREAQRRPVRWRSPLRRAVAESDEATKAIAGSWLDVIGEASDVQLLRRLSRGLRGEHRDSALGRRLARRVATPAFVEDQGRVTIRIGTREVEGSHIRRKVLALLCFLLSRAGMTATRDQVLDALWPNLSPDLALNSLNQTIYFLRRVFEPEFKEDLSPGYVHHASELVWLDPELVGSRSGRCGELLRQMPIDPSPNQVSLLASTYAGRFAIDFAYEEWASSYRDAMHAAYLETMERAIAADTNAGHFGRGTQLAQRALSVDPDAEQLELALLRLYRLTGSHAAAAEQYAHYAAFVRSELGIEPPPLEAL